LIGHRITIQQTRRIRQRMSEELGAKIAVAGQTFAAFPDPNVLLGIDEFPGVSSLKIDRLHGAARAALDGTLDREHLRSIPEADAIKQLRKIDGVGEFFAEGILMRGAGLVDAVTNDDMTPRAIELLYHLKERPDHAAVVRRAQAWRPYRMWALVLLNVWVRSQPPEVVGRRQIRNQPKPSRSKPKRATTR
jgi:DNA-3-methyladenine glycosylase II